MDLPTTPGGFGVIYMDPPWRISVWSEKGMGRSVDGLLTPEQMRNRSRQNRPERHYKTMSLEDIAAIPVEDVAAKNCVLIMWVVDPLLPEALEIAKGYGFKYKTTAFYWVKQRRRTSNRGRGVGDFWHKLFPMGTGYWSRTNPEQALLFTKGHPKRLSAAVRKLVISPRREHSRKPDRIYSDIEEMCAGPYLELFSRTTREGWTAWGNDTGKFDPHAPLFDGADAGASSHTAPAPFAGQETTHHARRRKIDTSLA